LLQFKTNKESIMSNFSGKAPTFAVWVISLVLFIVALLAQFGVVRMGAPIATWSWIIGFGLLLIACRVKGL
jgi:phosphoglycerol transferase MdoB-like AlkP superfamily enzyme